MSAQHRARDTHITPCADQTALFESTNLTHARQAAEICRTQCWRLEQCAQERDPNYQGTWAGELWVRNTNHDTRPGVISPPRPRRRPRELNPPKLETKTIRADVMRYCADAAGLDFNALSRYIRPSESHAYGMFLAALRCEGYSIHEIAIALGRDRSGISRALSRTLQRVDGAA